MTGRASMLYGSFRGNLVLMTSSCWISDFDLWQPDDFLYGGRSMK